MALQERIDVPDTALLAKPWFPEFPNDEIVEEIRDFVAETGKPYLWRGHTHSTPKPGSHLRYVEEFSLPRSCKARETWAPCPCCSLFFPKYKAGKIAWFPDEQIIRLIGPYCYAKLDSVGHKAATEELAKRQKERRDIEYLLKIAPKVDDLLDTIHTAHAIAVAADDFFPRLKYRIESVLRVRLWSAIRGGDLHISETLIERYRDAEGNEQERHVPNNRRYATIKGVEALSPDRLPKSERLDRLSVRLDELNLSQSVDVSMLDSSRRRELALKISRIIRDVESVFSEMRQELQILKPENFQTLRTWARRVDAPIHLILEREPDAFRVGRREGQMNRVPFSDSLFAKFPALPRIAKTKL